MFWILIKTRDSMSLQKYTRAIAALTVIGGIVASTSMAAYAATLTTASLSLSDSRISQSSSYTFSGSGWSTGQTIGCIEIDLGTTADGNGAPATSTAGSTLTSQSVTATGSWTIDNSQSASQKIRAVNATPVVPQSGARNIVFAGITNGATPNTSYYAVITTYTTNACTTPSDTVTVQFVYTNGQAATVNVDSSLTFSVAGVTGNGSETVNGTTITSALATTASTIPFGTATAASNRVAAQDVTVGTNAGSGYTVYVRYLGAMGNGAGSTINDLLTHTNTTPGTFSAAGTEAFGYTTEDATLSGTAARFTGNKWAAMTATNEEVIYNNASAANSTTRIGYQVGIASNTPAGAYTGTVIYTATPVY